MISVNKIEKKYRTDQESLIKLHLLYELSFIKGEELINSDIEILVYLIQSGPTELREFCYKAARIFYEVKPEEYAVKEQNVRNRIVKLEKRGFIVKKKKHNKTINIHPSLDIKLTAPTLLQYSLVNL